MLNWSSAFDEAYPATGATEEEIKQLVATLALPLSASEVLEINRQQVNPFPLDDPLHHTYQPFDPTAWLLPRGPLPGDYLSLLRWSNGGEFRSGDRWFQFLPAVDPLHGVRAMLLAYHVPQHMPGALPFALNRGGVLYVFDMRAAPRDGEYPIACSTCGNLGWEQGEFIQIASSFEEACRSTRNVETLL